MPRTGPSYFKNTSGFLNKYQLSLSLYLYKLWGRNSSDKLQTHFFNKV